MALLFLIAFVAIMLFPNRRAVSLVESLYQTNGASVGLISVVVLMTLAAELDNGTTGDRALFGAFMAGLILPYNQRMTTEIVERIESLSLALFLPLFFALTGLRTRIDLLTERSTRGYTLAIAITAVLGKLAGAAFHCKGIRNEMERLVGPGSIDEHSRTGGTGDTERELDLGIQSPPLFTMMFVMALVTTSMTTPILIAMKIGRQRDLAG